MKGLFDANERKRDEGRGTSGCKTGSCWLSDRIAADRRGVEIKIKITIKREGGIGILFFRHSLGQKQNAVEALRVGERIASSD